jgi:hypothetical protein
MGTENFEAMASAIRRLKRGQAHGSLPGGRSVICVPFRASCRRAGRSRSTRLAKGPTVTIHKRPLKKLGKGSTRRNIACVVSATGHKRKWCHARVMSVLPLKADIRQREWHVRYVP